MSVGKKKNGFVLEYFTMQADLINIRTFLRVRKIDEVFRIFKRVATAWQ